jgi:predicted dehydrogenase
MWLMGYPNPITVSGATYNHIASREAQKQNKEFTVEDLAMGFVRFDNGASLIVENSWALNQKEKELMETKLYGKKAGIVQRNVNQGYEFEAEVYLENEGSYFTQKLDTPAAPNSSTYKEFIDAIIEDREPSATAEHGVRLQKVLEGLYRSAEEGREIAF